MFRIANPQYLILLAAIPLLLLLFLLFIRWRKQAINRFGDYNVVIRLLPYVSLSKPWLKMIAVLLAASALILAAARPQVGSRLQEVKRKGVDVVIALDVSNSMNAEDIRPSRLERSKQAIYRMIDQLDGDRIGLIVFAGQAYVQLPITTDYGAAKLFLRSINTEMVPSQGTAIGAAIDMGVQAIGDSAAHNSAIVVITDGENHEDDAIESAAEAAKKGIVVHTIGMGSPEGSPVPVFSKGTRVGFLQDRSGTTVISKLDEAALQQIADAGKGKFVRASNSDDGIGTIIESLGKMEKREFASKLFTDYDDQFQYVLGVALLFLLFDFVLTGRKSEWFAKLDLFGEKQHKKQVRS
ncbi:MAG TPA: VWA domain-containing protein [Bacteroidia bacterium]|nr:VWA domain-containing protein [Bacteroidia bacterium]